MNTAQKAMAVAVVAILCIGAVYVILDDDGPTTRLRTSWDLVTVDEIADMSSSEAFEELQTACDRFVEQVYSGTLSPKAMGGLLDDLNDTIKETAYALGLFQWDYYRDSTGLSEEYVGWSAFDSRCMDIRNTALREVLEGPGGDTLRKVIGDETADALLADESMSEEEIALREAESEAMSRYYEATDPEDLAAILLALVDVRNDLAALYGYDSYADYAYEVTYQRSFGPDETAVFTDLVRDTVGGLFMQIREVQGESWTRPSYTYEGQDELFADVEVFIDTMGPEMSELYDYMTGNGLVDFEDLDTKQSGAFTMQLSPVGDEMFLYIYSDPYLGINDMTTLVHEFGHASAHALAWSSSPDMEVSEIQSQGLEMLFSLWYDEAAGSSDASMMSTLIMLYAILEGSIYDEFQQRVYEGDASTAEELDALFEEICAGYGYDPGRPWYTVSHTFSQPFYYVSYAVSAFNALEIFVDALEDPEAATEEYLDVLATPYGYDDMVADLGMCDAFDAEDFAQVMDAVSAWVDGVTGDTTEAEQVPA